jgi:integral membrane protein
MFTSDLVPHNLGDSVITAKQFKVIAAVESISWACLLVFTILKYAADWPKGVQIFGPIHGVLFIALVGSAYILMQANHWPLNRFVRIVLSSFVPLYGYVLIDHETGSAPA